MKKKLKWAFMVLLVVLITLNTLISANGCSPLAIIFNQCNRGLPAKGKFTLIKMQELRSRIHLYELAKGSLPKTLDNLLECYNNPSEPKKEICPLEAHEEDMLRDAWNNPLEFKIRSDEKRYEIISLGGDGKIGGQGIDEDIAVYENS